MPTAKPRLHFLVHTHTSGAELVYARNGRWYYNTGCATKIKTWTKEAWAWKTVKKLLDRGMTDVKIKHVHEDENFNCCGQVFKES